MELTYNAANCTQGKGQDTGSHISSNVCFINSAWCLLLARGNSVYNTALGGRGGEKGDSWGVHFYRHWLQLSDTFRIMGEKDSEP